MSELMEIPQFGENLKEYIDRPGAYAVIVKNGKVLLLEVDGKYHLPGGGIDAGESPERALEREIREETGYKVLSLQPLGRANQFISTSDIGPLNKRGTFYIASVTSQDLNMKVESNHHVAWMSADQALEKPLADFQRWAIRKALGQ